MQVEGAPSPDPKQAKTLAATKAVELLRGRAADSGSGGGPSASGGLCRQCSLAGAVGLCWQWRVQQQLGDRNRADRTAGQSVALWLV